MLATGISHRLSFFVQKAFLAAGILNWQDYVVSTAANTRPADTNFMVGDSRAAITVAHDIALPRDPTALWEI